MQPEDITHTGSAERKMSQAQVCHQNWSSL